MGLRIIYGRAGSGKSSYCFQEVAKRLTQEKKIYIITPEQFSFTAEKKLMEAIQTEAVIKAEVITFSRMAKRVLAEVGEKRSKLTKSGKAMLMFSLLQEQKKNLRFLGKSEENVNLAITTITELKKHGVSIEELKAEQEKTENRYLKTKLEDILILYEAYEKAMLANYQDETDDLTKLSEVLEQTEFGKECVFYLDEFSGFTFQEYNIIKALSKQAKQINVTICTDSLLSSSLPEQDIFYANKETASRLTELAKQENIRLEQPIYLKETLRFKTKELSWLEQNWGKVNQASYLEKVEQIELSLCQNAYAEIEQIAKKIHQLVKQERIRYQEIAIITKTMEKDASLIRAIFPQYKIPVFIDEKRELSQNAVIQYLLSIFEILSRNFSQESVFHYLKTGFVDIEEEDRYRLENYCTKWGIKQNKWKREFTYESQDEKKKQEVEHWETLRKQIVTPLLRWKKECSEEKNIKGMAKATMNLLIHQQIEQKVKKKREELEEKGKPELASELKTSYEIILTLFDEMVALLGEKKVTIDQFSQIVKMGLTNSGLGKIPGTQDQVTVGDVERSRSHQVKVIFIIGLNDGNYPSVKKEEGFLGEEEREILKQEGIALAKSSKENLYEENFNLYKAFSTAEEKLYLSYRLSDGEGKSLRPSVLIYQMQKMFPTLKEQSDRLQRKDEIINETGTYPILIEKIMEQKEGKPMDNLWKQVYHYYQSQSFWKTKLKQDLAGLSFTNLPENIESNMIQKLYGNTLTTSISKMERFQNCPFSYYLQYGLRLKEKEMLRIETFDTGSFMHEIIDLFFERVNEKEIPLPELLENQEEIQKLVEEIVNEILAGQKKYRFQETASVKILVRRLKRIVSKALVYMIESLVHSDFEIQGTEVSFGQKADYPPMVITLENGKRIEITGKIDRIDTAKGEKGTYVRIIDYKSSAKNIDLNEVYAGLQIQLLTYLDVACEEKDLLPAGILYFSLLEQMVKADQKISEEEIEKQIRANFKMKGLILADVQVIQMHDHEIKEGKTSQIIPAAITTSGGINQQRTNGVKEEEFGILQRYIQKTIKDIAKEILTGKIEIHPYQKKGKKPCDYCAYHSICGFDRNLPGNKCKFLPNETKEKVLSKIREELRRAENRLE